MKAKTLLTSVSDQVSGNGKIVRPPRDDRFQQAFDLVKQNRLPMLELQGDELDKLKSTTELPISELIWLREVDLSKNALKDFSDDMINLKNLQVLNLNSNQFESVPTQITEFTDLKELRIRLNFLKTWPLFIANLASLEVLDIAFNKISYMSFSRKSKSKIAGQTSLKLKKHKNRPIYTGLTYLDISFNHFESFPTCVLKFKNLSYLNISSNALKKIPADVIRLRNSLKTLVCSDCSFERFPENILNLDNLDRLDIHNNAMINLSNSLDKMDSLTWINVSKCEISTLAALAKCKGLKSITATNNRITQITSDISKLVYLEFLDLKKNELTDINPVLTALTNLQTLNLSENKIKSVVSELGDCTSLKNLYLQDNAISGPLPDTLSKLVNLIDLDISNNNINNLFDFSKVIDLQLFKANNNDLSLFPIGLDKLTSLKLIHLHCNRISELPDAIYTLTNLEELVLRRNNITTELKKEIATLPNLHVLNINNNEFATFPFEEFATKNTTIVQLHISQNSLSFCEPPEIFEKWRAKYKVDFNNEFEKPDKILQGLYLGSASSVSNKQFLKSLNITHVLTIAKDLPPPHPNDFIYKVIPEDDTKTSNLKNYFKECFEFIEQGRNSGGIVVHCLQGVSRSATITVAYVMNSKGAPLKTAFHYVAKIRPKIYPNPGFRAQLSEFEKELTKENKITLGKKNAGSSDATSPISPRSRRPNPFDENNKNNNNNNNDNENEEMDPSNIDENNNNNNDNNNENNGDRKKNVSNNNDNKDNENDDGGEGENPAENPKN